MYELIFFAVLLALGFVFGQAAERKHFKSLMVSEKALQSILIFTVRFPPLQTSPIETTLVAGNVVISVDYFKTFIAKIRSLFGGRLSSYESLIERGRREAIVRMKQEARSKGANQIFNVKIETASISGDASNGVGSVEVYAYGTALIPTNNGAP